MLENLFVLDRFNDKMNISIFARHYGDDVEKWIESQTKMILRLCLEKSGRDVLEVIDGDVWACREIAIKYAQYLSPELELTCLKILDSFFKCEPPYQKIEGSIISFKVRFG